MADDTGRRTRVVYPFSVDLVSVEARMRDGCDEGLDGVAACGGKGNAARVAIVLQCM